jgi:alkylation response protein AidB-like acyl-CoA dehydrogenase
MTTTQAALELLSPQLEGLGSVTQALASTAAEYDRTGEFPVAGIQAVHDAGLLTAAVAPRYGGAGIGISELARVLQALGEGDPSVALIASMTLLPHAMQALRPHWPEDLYQRILAESAHRPTLMNHARVEPELGSPARGGLPATTAHRTASGWAITGRKRFVTGAGGLSYVLVWAGTDEPEPRVGTFVVPADSPGVEVVDTWHQLGLRASCSHDVVFTGVEVPLDHVIGVTDKGPEAEQNNLEGGPIHLPIASLYIGVGRAAQRYFHQFAHERVPANLGRPVATTDRFKQAAGEIETLLSTAEQLIYSATQRVDRGETVPPTDALASRVIAVRHTVAATQIALKLLGNPGLSKDAPLERHFRDVQSAGVHAPQEDTALHVIGAAVLASWRKD